ncbi:MAG: UDP-N-acetylglucosamine--N-acetylmuramyl-(pentapeptide) pyrophosphoryl-undecaprenol N-acetylglucosamine transferase [Candidatus Brocadiae bacterium]|nr:UDP-N-acetylglucosamine--N-acetylmuramyl-(pentapeptide) pyrophosphoryl-undecaprenol N-acetylglucosamine transferase [Candidatus Brocadiia bacterium]
MILQLFRAQPERKMRRAPAIAFAGGGTGGHLFPAIALADELRRRWPDARVTFLCTQRPIDANILSRTRFEWRAMPAPRWVGFTGLVGGFVPESWSAFRAAWTELRSFHADVVVGVGGYGSVPAVLAAKALGIPVVLLEQNAKVGRANQFLARFSKLVCCQWREAVRAVPGGVFTGNPIRAMDRDVSAKAALGLDPRKPTLGILGGSLGARAVNEFFRSRAERMRDWNVLHATGEADWPRVEGAYRFQRLTHWTTPFCDRMDTFYGAADLVVCRAGGTTIAEATALGVPLALVPLPNSAHGHQQANAQAAERAGAAIHFPESALDDAAFDRIERLLRDRTRLARMSSAGWELGNAVAAQVVMRKVEGILQEA